MLMYKRPRPLLTQIQPPPAVISPSEDVGDRQWKKWGMSSLASRGEQVVAAPEPKIDYEALEATRLAKELQAIKEAARQEGLALGQAEGMKAGLEKGTAQGHQDGYAAGIAQASEEQQVAAARLVKLVEQADQDFIQIQESMGQALVQMGARIAGQILKMKMEDPAPVVLATVNEVLRQNEGSQCAVTLYLNSEDINLVSKSLASEQADALLRLVAAPELGRGDVKIKTKFGEIDATLATRWANAMASIGLTTPMPPIK